MTALFATNIFGKNLYLQRMPVLSDGRPSQTVGWQRSAQCCRLKAISDHGHPPPTSVVYDAPAAAATCWRLRRRTSSLHAMGPTAAGQPPLLHHTKEEAFFGSVPELLRLLQRMAIFTLPLTALVLSEPLLVWCTSLFIGQFSTITELAALGPANIVIGGVGMHGSHATMPCLA